MWTNAQIVDYAALRRCINGLWETYPFLKVTQIGRSHAGRSIFSLSLGSGKKCVLFAAGFHGSEWITELLLLRFAEELCRSIQMKTDYAGVDVVSFLQRREILIVPCVNPDGTEIFLHGAEAAGEFAPLVRRAWEDNILWNANAAGVDINHNFDAGWDLLRAAEKKNGIDAPAPRQFGGVCAESEPETRALCALCRRKKPGHVLAFHSQGEEIFWRYGKKDPPEARTLMCIFTAVSGYKPVRNAGLYAHGGFKDWFIREFDRPGFTVEVGKGTNPLPLSDLDGIFEKLRRMMVLAAVL